MTKGPVHPDDAANPRRIAEERVQTGEMGLHEAASSPEETLRVLHELRMHQIELEVRNEELEQRVAERTEELQQAHEALRAEVAERKRAEADVKAAHTKLEVLWGMASLADADLKTISDHIVASLAHMTGSGYGFYGFVNEDESVMTIYAWSGGAMLDCSMVDKPQRFPISEAGVWGEAIRRRTSLVLNDYSAAHPAKKGLPQGHVPLTNLLVVPLFSRGRIRAVAAVANRAADYGQEDVLQITAFLGGAQAIVERTWYGGGVAGERG